jgi:hypothetical protein
MVKFSSSAYTPSSIVSRTYAGSSKPELRVSMPAASKARSISERDSVESERAASSRRTAPPDSVESGDESGSSSASDPSSWFLDTASITLDALKLYLPFR